MEYRKGQGFYCCGYRESLHLIIPAVLIVNKQKHFPVVLL